MSGSPSELRRRTLHQGWTLGGPDDAPVPATVPGCVHTDLLAARVIPDPFVHQHEDAVQWVGRRAWTYTTTFEVTAAEAARERRTLVFEGLDTLATVLLDGEPIATTESMHRTHRLDVTDRLGAGRHELTVGFASAELEAERRRAEHGHLPTASFDQPYQFVRKMACAWGWDWGPTLNTCGMWKPVLLESWDAVRIAALRPSPKIAGDDRGRVRVDVDLDRARAVGAALDVTLRDLDGRTIATTSLAVAPGADHATVDLDAGRVGRWWPHTMGDQPRYRLDVVLTDDAGGVLDSTSRRIGFRTIELDTSADELGSAFTIVVNGIPVFARGLNWIPDDPLVVRVDRERYRGRLTELRALGADLVRVWGGGIYESDDFYDLCDELGILVWQDFAFACAAYPEELLADEVAAEARDAVNRLMSHPSLALWNGNNENFMGWFEWGWPALLDGRTWGAGFYLDLLPGIVGELDPTRPYWPGSPYSGSMEISTDADAHGCRHVWNVWNEVDHRRYRDDVPRFVSEFGWQAPPTRSTIDRWIHDDPLRPDSPGMLHHQKAMDGQGKLTRGLAPFFDVPDDVDDWLWAMQLNQARAVATGVEHYRSYRGVCMGTVWWQFNDCWPVTSWAVVDGDGRRKPAFHALRRAYRDRLVTIQPRGGSLVVALVNDGADDWEGTLTIRRVAFDGTVIAQEAVPASVPARSAQQHVVEREVAAATDPRAELLVADVDGVLAERATWFFLTDRELHLAPADLDVAIATGGAGVSADVTARGLVRDLTVLADRLGPRAEADDGLVTLLPGESTSIGIRGLTETPDEVALRAALRSANDLVVWCLTPNDRVRGPRGAARPDRR